MALVIEMPKLSDTMAVGTVVKWHKTIGEAVANGDILAEIETDKATMELENFEDGVLLDIFVEEGHEAPIGTPLAVVGNQGEDITSLIPAVDLASKDVHIENKLEEVVESKIEPTAAPKDDLLDSESPSRQETNIDQKPTDRLLVSPLAKKIAEEKNIDLASIKGSGPRGRITKKDLENQNQSTSPLPIDTSADLENNSSGILSEKSIPLSKMRSVIATRLLDSKTTIPHFYLQKEINAQSIKHARLSINEKLAKVQKLTNSASLKISVNDLILKACAETIKWHPEINTSWDTDKIKFHKDVNLAFGVAIEDGLLTPVIRKANTLSLRSISTAAKELISKARNKKLMPDEMAGSTFTVTNLGMYGVDFFSGIINPPNAAILSVGASRKKAVVGPNGEVTAGETMMLGLSCDHRLVDGAIAANFLQSLAENLENPSSMLV
jgi:pyruvate dehydrogenase E2 component (dihydrolipoamide acetyltransferase)